MPLLESLNKHKLHHALNAARVALVIAGSFAAANAKDSRSTFGVSATVNAVARLELQSAPAEVEVTAGDVSRGFIDVAEPTRLVIRSNSPTGFALDVTTINPMLASVVVRGFDSVQSLGAEGGTIVQRWQSPHAVNLSLRFKLVLAPGLAPGRYAWPMRVTARPLDAV
jgi:hypothetical protein